MEPVFAFSVETFGAEKPIGRFGRKESMLVYFYSASIRELIGLIFFLTDVFGIRAAREFNYPFFAAI